MTTQSGRLAAGILLLLFLNAADILADPVDRIRGSIDSRRTRVIPGNTSSLAQPKADRGTVDQSQRLDYVVLLFKRSAAQQAQLDQLLLDQQNPSSPRFHQWLTPEEFAGQFGLTTSDQSKVSAWLHSEGFQVKHAARGRNWIAFSGTAAQVSASLHTVIHRFEVNGETHFANVSEPSVPEALADVTGGFLGLNDFRAKPLAVPAPDYNSTSGSHYLAPADWETIYDVSPLTQAGLDGTGQSIAIVGESDVLLSDLRGFRARYGLPPKDPKLLLYDTDPGFNSNAQIEANLDLEWAGAIAPQATIYYIYGPDAITAAVAAVDYNVAPVISISYGYCEIDFGPSFYRAIAQQGNAQGITILSASGDTGAAGCAETEAFATRGRSVSFPAVLPEVTAVGGTQFVEGNGTYWGAANSSTFGSALSYIPEAAWNELSNNRTLSTGGGASLIYPQPVWQNGPGVPNDNARHIPDIALSAALHDAYLIYYGTPNVAVAGTSASTPSFAGIIALLNQYQVSKGFQKKPGLGNINPQLYRLAQSTPSVFHDVTSGSNIVPCAQASPDCVSGSFGYPAAAGYDMATGLGSIDASNFVTLWNTQTNGVSTTLFVTPSSVSVNDIIAVTLAVTPATGNGTPTGMVSFSVQGTPVGSAPLTTRGGQQVADLYFPAYQVGGVGFGFVIAAEYSGDAAFSSGGATKTISVTTPSGEAAIIPSAPFTVWPQPLDAQGLSWQTRISLQELAGVAAMITGFTIDGQPQDLSRYFPSPDIPSHATVTANVVFRNLAAPLTRTFGITGVDANGHGWSRQLSVLYQSTPTYDYFSLTATPLVVAQNPAADPACQWSVQLNVDDLGGFGINQLHAFEVGGLNSTSQISSVFGTTRLDAFGGLQGALCFGGITPPAHDTIEVDLSNGNKETLTVSFAPPPASISTLSVSPTAISLAAPATIPTANLTVNLSDKTQGWTASIFPANRITSWLTASQLTGVGTTQITLTASGAGFEPGVYRATIVFQSPNAVPHYLNVPVMFVLGGSATTSITAAVNAASFTTGISPGMLLSLFGTNLANTPQTYSKLPLPYSLGGVSATVNGIAAPMLYVSSNQVNIQVPYEVGAGPGVLGINNNGQIAGYAIQIAPSAPGIFPNPITIADPAPENQATILVNGAGDTSPYLATGFSPPAPTTSSTPTTPILPISVTVGGVPAFVQSAVIAPGLVGTTAVTIQIPASVPARIPDVVVTVGGVSSAPSPLPGVFVPQLPTQ